MATALLFLFALAITTASWHQEMEALQIIQTQVSQGLPDQRNVALRDCAKLYRESESRLSFIISDKSAYYTNRDMLTWVSAVMTNHRTCLDGLQEMGYLGAGPFGKNLTMLLREALVLYAKNKGKAKVGQPQETVSETDADAGLLVSWSTSSSKADFTVAQDGSGTHRTIKQAVDALAVIDNNRPERAVIYVKSGGYNEIVV